MSCSLYLPTLCVTTVKLVVLVVCKSSSFNIHSPWPKARLNVSETSLILRALFTCLAIFWLSAAYPTKTSSQPFSWTSNGITHNALPSYRTITLISKSLPPTRTKHSSDQHHVLEPNKEWAFWHCSANRDWLAIEFKETHLGPLKNSLGGRSTSTSTIKADSVEPMDQKLSTSSSNDISGFTFSMPSSMLMVTSCVRSYDFSTSSATETRYPCCDSSWRQGLLTASSLPATVQSTISEFGIKWVLCCWIDTWGSFNVTYTWWNSWILRSERSPRLGRRYQLCSYHSRSLLFAVPSICPPRFWQGSSICGRCIWKPPEPILAWRKYFLQIWCLPRYRTDRAIVPSKP